MEKPRKVSALSLSERLYTRRSNSNIFHLFALIAGLAFLYIAQIFQLFVLSTFFLSLLSFLFLLSEIQWKYHYVYNFNYPKCNAIILTENFFLFYHCFPSKSDALFLFTPLFFMLISPIRLMFCFLPVSNLFFLYLSFSYSLADLSPAVGSRQSFFSQDNVRPFNCVALLLVRDLPISIPWWLRCFSSSDFLTLRFLFPYPPLSTLSVSLSRSRSLSLSYPVSPSPTAWRVILRKPWYFVGHGVQSHGGSDEAWPYLPPTTRLRTNLPIYFILPYPILLYPPTLLSQASVCPCGKRIRRKARRARLQQTERKYDVALSLRDRIFRNKHYVRSHFRAPFINFVAFIINIINVSNKQTLIAIERSTKLWL